MSRDPGSNDVAGASPRDLAAEIVYGLLGAKASPAAVDELTNLFTNHRPGALQHWVASVASGLVSPGCEAAKASTTPWDNAPAGLLRLRLGDARSDRFCGDGWSHHEYGGRWSVGTESTLVLGPPGVETDSMLILAFYPLFHDTHLPDQRLDVLVNGALVGRFETTGGARRIVSCPVPAALIVGKAALTINLRHPDHCRPADLPHHAADKRQLAFYVSSVSLIALSPSDRAGTDQIRSGLASPAERITASPTASSAADDAALALIFESLGDNCEFGFVQRELGVEPISLLRFTGMAVDALIRGLETRFNQLGSSDFRVTPNIHGEFMGIDDAYCMNYHTERFRRDIDASTLRAQEVVRLNYLGRKLIEDIEDGAKIFVIKDDYGLPVEIVQRLMRVIHAIGPAVVLWVAVADDTHPVGSVDLVVPGLMRGYIGRFAPLIQGPQTILLEDWRAVMHNARHLWPQAKP